MAPVTAAEECKNEMADRINSTICDGLNLFVLCIKFPLSHISYCTNPGASYNFLLLYPYHLF